MRIRKCENQCKVLLKAGICIFRDTFENLKKLIVFSISKKMGVIAIFFFHLESHNKYENNFDPME